MQHRDGTIEFLLRGGTAGNLEVDGAERVLGVLTLRYGRAATDDHETQSRESEESKRHHFRTISQTYRDPAANRTTCRRPPSALCWARLT